MKTWYPNLTAARWCSCLWPWSKARKSDLGRAEGPRLGPLGTSQQPSYWPLCRCWHERISAVRILWCCWLDLQTPSWVSFIILSGFPSKRGFQKTIRYQNQGALGLNSRSNLENSDSPKNAWTEKARMLNLHNSWTQNQKNLWRLWKLETLSSSFLCNSRATSTELYLECINHVWSFLTQQGGQIAAVFVKAL